MLRAPSSCLGRVTRSTLPMPNEKGNNVSLLWPHDNSMSIDNPKDALIKLRLPTDMKARFEVACRSEEVTPSQVLRMAIKNFITDAEWPEATPRGSMPKRAKTKCDPSMDEIRNLYWRLRALRASDQAGRRRIYRQIKRIKDELLSKGQDPEELRLYCRQFASLDEAAILRHQQYLEKQK